MKLKDALIANYPSKESQTFNPTNQLNYDETIGGYKQIMVVIDIEHNELSYIVINTKRVNRSSNRVYEKTFSTLEIACKAYENLK